MTEGGWVRLAGGENGSIVIEMNQRGAFIVFRDSLGARISITESELRQVPMVSDLVNENVRLHAAVQAAAQGGNVILPMNESEKAEVMSTIGELTNLSVSLGVETGLTAAAIELRNLAGHLFSNGQDTNALRMRDAAGVIERLGKEHAETHEWQIAQKAELWETVRRLLDVE